MIILTGASGGIGEEMLNDLTKFDDVIGIYNNSIPQSQGSSRVSLQKLNLSNESDIHLFIEQNKSVLKNISVLHAAGSSEDSLAINHRLDAWNEVVDVNLTANFLLNKALLPLMVKQKWGRVIHFSSIRVSSGTISYSTTKHGLLGMSQVLAKEYAKFNITSNTLILGAFNTGMFQHLNTRIKKEMIDAIPSKNLGEVKNIINAVKFIIDSPFLNGASIKIDGGASA